MKESLLVSVAGKTMAFGLEWMPLIEALGAREARRRASRYRATHYVLASNDAGAVGLASIQSGKSGTDYKKQVIYSAAQNVAALYQSGTWVLCINLMPDCWWLVAVHEGVVIMRTDTLAPNPESFSAVVSELRRAYPGMSYLQSGVNAETPSLINLAYKSGPPSTLQTRRSERTGLTVRLFVLGVAAAAAYAFFVSASPSGATRHSEAQVTAEQDSKRLWRVAQQTALNNIVVHGVQGTQRLLRAFYDVAVSPAGWHLRQVECTPDIQGWECVAQFYRRYPGTDNQALELALPASWTVSARDLDHAQASWSVPYAGLTLAQSVIPAETDNRSVWPGILQRVSIAFNSIAWSDAKALPVTVPVDGQGRPVPRPEALTMYQSRSLKLFGPLRSYALLLADFSAVRWSRAVLSINDNHARAGVRASRFQLLLEGELHERVE